MNKATFDKAAVINEKLQKVTNSLEKIELAKKNERQNIILTYDGGSYLSSRLYLTEDAQKVLEAAVIEINNILIREKAVLAKQFKDL